MRSKIMLAVACGLLGGALAIGSASAQVSGPNGPNGLNEGKTGLNNPSNGSVQMPGETDATRRRLGDAPENGTLRGTHPNDGPDAVGVPPANPAMPPSNDAPVPGPGGVPGGGAGGPSGAAGSGSSGR